MRDEGEFDWSQARVVLPPGKQAISVRIDRDVLDFFKSRGTRLPDAHKRDPAELHGSQARGAALRQVSWTPGSRRLGWATFR